MSDALKIIKYAMDMELKGQDFYNSFKDKVKNQEIKQLFKNFASLEHDHYEILKKQLDSLSKNNTWTEFNPNFKGEDEIFLKAKEEVTDTNLEEKMADLPIIRMAYMMENDFAKFYENAIEYFKDDKQAQEVLQKLVKWEHNHAEIFYKEYEELMRQNWFSQGFAPF